MYWYRLEQSLGRFSLVGTTVSAAECLPDHLAADEKHTTLAGEKVYLAATAGGGCCLGMALAETAGNDNLRDAYGVFREEAQHLDPQYRPETVNTDGWQATQAAWRSLFHKVTLILCFLHSFLKIRERAVHLKELFGEIGRRVWEAYSAPEARLLLPAAPPPPGMGLGPRGQGGCSGEGAVAVRQTRSVRQGLRSSRLLSDE